MRIQNPVKGAKLSKYPNGSIYQFFGENKELYLKAIGSNGHNGIDIVAPKGTPILATNGEVIEVKNTPEGYGKHVRILTDPDVNGKCLELVFGHLDSILVKVGEMVYNEQVIGGMGNTGFVISGGTPYWGTAPGNKGVHLHFGVRVCNTIKGKWRTTYSGGKEVYVENYENGTFGYVNPFDCLDLPEATEQMNKILQLWEKIYNAIKGRS